MGHPKLPSGPKKLGAAVGIALSLGQPAAPVDAPHAQVLDSSGKVMRQVASSGSKRDELRKNLDSAPHRDAAGAGGGGPPDAELPAERNGLYSLDLGGSVAPEAEEPVEGLESADVDPEVGEQPEPEVSEPEVIEPEQDPAPAEQGAPSTPAEPEPDAEEEFGPSGW